ncbi:porin [Albimonas sp. CAU 1670]|uniref:porin n=1 Tax=Albimonas sp. CAU 1670 TaxID=3032599 RepID=UPI0023D99E3E|nr:porin [Albimonas sp. CAU 1670]MDF2232307.1 porin [Albimonas sp. CAU 1670]
MTTPPARPRPPRAARRLLALLTLLAAQALPAAPALAEDAADGLPRTAVRLPDGGVLRLYGQINRGLLYYDDGRSQRGYALIDNANSPSRIGLNYLRAGERTTWEGVFEAGYSPYSSDRASQSEPRPSRDDFELSRNNIRKLELAVSRPVLGKLSLGQGSMASDGITEIDFSETSVAAYSSIGASAAGQFLRLSPAGGGGLSGIRVTDAFASFDGARRARLRYDTPPIAKAITASVSYGHNLLSDSAAEREKALLDLALRFERKQGHYWLSAGGGYHGQVGGTQILAGSGSVLHVPTGLNLTLAAGAEDDTSSRILYAKLGVRRPKLAPWGETAFSVDLYAARDPVLDLAAGIASSSSRSVGLAVVQKIDAARVELWGTWRAFRYADSSADYEDGHALFAGARWRF